MNIDKYTKKSIEAIQSAQNIAAEHGNQQIEQTHLFYALLAQENGLISSLIRSMGVNPSALLGTLQTKIDSLPKVSGGSQYFSQAAASAIDEAEKTASNMKDEYVSVEHIMLGIIKKADPDMKQILRGADIDENKFLSALKNGSPPTIRRRPMTL